MQTGKESVPPLTRTGPAVTTFKLLHRDRGFVACVILSAVSVSQDIIKHNKINKNTFKLYYFKTVWVIFVDVIYFFYLTDKLNLAFK